MQVFPHPNAPGMQHVPPRIDGKRKSRTLCPVNNGTSPDILPATGLGCLTDHLCHILNSTSLSSYSTTISGSMTL